MGEISHTGGMPLGQKWIVLKTALGNHMYERDPGWFL